MRLITPLLTLAALTACSEPDTPDPEQDLEIEVIDGGIKIEHRAKFACVDEDGTVRLTATPCQKP